MPAWDPSNGDRPPGVCPFALSPLPVYSRAGAAETVERLGHLTFRDLASSADRPAGRPVCRGPWVAEATLSVSPSGSLSLASATMLTGLASSVVVLPVAATALALGSAVGHAHSSQSPGA